MCAEKRYIGHLKAGVHPNLNDILKGLKKG